MTAVLIVLVVLVVLAVSLAGASVRVLREYERGVVFRFGRLVAQKGPGLVLLMPIADRMVRVTLRTITHTIPPQDVITRDNVPARVDAVAYFRVVDADASVVDIEDYLRATSEIAKTTLRSVLGKAELDTLLSERERLNEDLQRIIDEQTEPWGIKVVTVEIKDVGIPQDMQRAMARQAEAERDRRAKVINAEAEFQAAARLAEAADVLSGNPAALQLRYLQTLAEVGKGEGSTVLLPLPLDVIGSVIRGAEHNGRANGRGLAPVTYRADSLARRRTDTRHVSGQWSSPAVAVVTQCCVKNSSEVSRWSFRPRRSVRPAPVPARESPPRGYLGHAGGKTPNTQLFDPRRRTAARDRRLPRDAHPHRIPGCASCSSSSRRR